MPNTNKSNRIRRRIKISKKILKKKILKNISSKKISAIKRPTNTDVSIGIYLGNKNLSLVKIISPGKNKDTHPIVKCGKFPFPPGITKESEEFDNFLQTTLIDFCEIQKPTNTWVIIPTEHCEIHFLRIPKVSSRLLNTTIQWHLRKDAALNEETALLDYELRGESGGPGDKKTDIMCYTAPIAEVEKLKTLFAKINFPLHGISTVQFAVQNIFLQHMITPQEKYTTYLFIGNNHSRIDIYNHGKLILTRNIKTGVDSIVNTLSETLKITDPDAAQNVLFKLAGDNTSINLPDGTIINRGEIIDIIIPVMERLVRQIDRTLNHFVLTLGGTRDIKNFYISSGIPVFSEIFTYFSSQLGSKCKLFDPIKHKAKMLSYEERNFFLPAYGIALSNNAYTPNFLYTHKEKAKAAHTIKINRGILISLIGIVVICAGIFAVQMYKISGKITHLSKIEKELKSTAALIHKETITQLIAGAGEKQKVFTAGSRRYRGIGVITEIARLTPKSINLSSLKLNFTEKPAIQASPQVAATPGVISAVPIAGTANKTENLMVIEGELKGDQNDLGMMFANYIIDLKASPMFSEVTVVSNKIETTKNKTSLAFAVNFKIGGKGVK